MESLEHPFKAELQRVREIILNTDSKMQETIKWGAPTFFYKRNLATLTVRTKKYVQLFFQQGALISDRFGILEGEADQVRVARFKNMQEIEAKKEALQAVVRAWITVQDQEA
jgi:uncharacterized protein YdeI (YjbR/CyaY-like superfamily)